MIRIAACRPTLGLCLVPFLVCGIPARADEAARPIELSVDATEAPRKLLHARLVIPAKPGPLTLYYPKWIQGEHMPNGPINDLSGLKIQTGGKAIAWKRDDVDLYAFHCTVPEGADAVEVSMDYLAPSAKEGYSASASMTARLAVLNWHLVLLYPKGAPVRDQRIRASLTLPEGWTLGTALPIDSAHGHTSQFQTVSLGTLADSTVLCGEYLKEVPLSSGDGPPHYLVLACDSAAGLELSSTLRTHYERLVAEAGALFGARHYRSYRFLVTMSDQIRPTGIEHHECSDNRVPERFLLDDSYRKLSTAWLLPHEYVHSWNGKYRRPAGLATPDFQQPMKTRLLWVYEGLTEYLGFVLAARSGLYTPEISRENWALVADWARNQTGRTWRPLEDTTAAAPHLYAARTDWSHHRRGVDFYDEGALLWLDVDTLIREKTDGRKSLDDFCRAFHGGTSGPPEVKPYTFDDVVQTLNGVVAHDWKEFLQKRLTSTSPEPPLDGITRGGWKLVYRDKPGDLLKARDSEEKSLDLTTAVGLLLKDDGTVIDVVPDKAADKAGVGPGMKVVAVNGRRLSTERLRQAVAATRQGGKMDLLLENGDFFRTVALDYADGEKYPHLERNPGKPDLLADILRPRASKSSPVPGGEK
jgi:predicted metalloprotease with PDZ domain